MESHENVLERFEDSIAAKCRYGDIAERIWKGWEVIWMDAEDSYQGHASFVVRLGDKYCFYEWWYGSCSGCDGWEADGKDDDVVEKEMRDTALWFDSKDELKKWLDMLDSNPISNYSMERGGGLVAGLDLLGGGLRDRIEALRKYFGMSTLSERFKDDD